MIDNFEEELQCPYNMAHTIRRGRMQIHLTKCRPSKDDVEYFDGCPFDATHVFPAQERELHEKLCESRRILDDFVLAQNRPRPGTVPVNIQIPITDGEDWDNDLLERPVLDIIQENARKRPVILAKSGAPPAERRAHRMEERQRFQRLTNAAHSSNQ